MSDTRVIGDSSPLPFAAISARRVTKDFAIDSGRRRVLNEFTLDIVAGSFTSIVGPSGCGKTTFIRIVAGLEKFDTGNVTVHGESVLAPGADRGMVFQDYALFPWMTVTENIALGLKLRGLSRAERAAKVASMLRLVNLVDFAGAYPKELSGGMTQRVALARALVNEPRVLLMDEPFAAVDALTRRVLQQELDAIWQSTETTIVLVTHSVEEAVLLSDRVIVLSRSPADVLLDTRIDLPRPRFTREVLDSPEHARYVGLLAENLKGQIAPHRQPASPETVGPRSEPAADPASAKTNSQAGAPDRKRKLVRFAQGLIPFVAILGLWQAATELKLWPQMLLPSPYSVVAGLLEMTKSGLLLEYVQYSLGVLFLGVGTAFVIGVPLATLVGVSVRARPYLDPFFNFLQAIPGLAWVPLAILWFGLGTGSIVFVIFTSALFPLLFTLSGGLATINRRYAEALQTLGGQRRHLLWYVLLPAGLPFLLTGMRLCVGYGFRSLVGAEMIAGSSGLGYMIFNARQYLRSELVVGGMIIIGLIWLVMDRLILAPIQRTTVERWGTMT